MNSFVLPGKRFLSAFQPIRARRERVAFLGLLGLLLLSSTQLRAGNLSGGAVVSGSASIDTVPGSTTITAGNNSVLRWDAFNVGTGELVRFIQPGADSRVLNWIGGSTPSQIDGSILANGQVYLANPAGVYFGGTAVVDVGRLYAIGGSLSKADFLAGMNRFTGLTGEVRNAGSIRGSEVALIGRMVANTGTIVSRDGFIALGAGDSVLLGQNGSNVYVDAGSSSSSTTAPVADSRGVVNTGTLDAGRGTAVLAAGDLYSVAISHEGRLIARTLQVQGQGRGEVRVSGSIDASSTAAGEHGGRIVITGEKVALFSGAAVDASGAAGGGSVLVGGGFQGANSEVRNATTTFVQQGAALKADATVSGNGGKVVVWSDSTTRYRGSLSAQGGPLAGNGGEAEVSGKGTLVFDGEVNLLSHVGRAGSLLLDPTNITIQAINPDLNGDGTTGDDVAAPGIGGGQYPGQTSVITSGQVGALLGSTGGVALSATNNIDVLSDIVWVQQVVGSGLTLTAGGTINLNASIQGFSATAFATVPTVTLNGAVVPAPGSFVRASQLNLNGSGNVGSAGARLESRGPSVVFNKASGDCFLYTDGLRAGSNLSGTTPGSIDVLSVGSIGQTAPLSVGGTSDFQVGSSGLLLPNLANRFTGAVSLNSTGGGAMLSATGSIVLGTTSVSNGPLAITSSSGSITQVGPIIQGGKSSGSTFTVDGGYDLLLHTQANDFAGNGVSFVSNGLIRDVGLRDDSVFASLTGLPTSARNIDLYFGNAAIALPGYTASGHLNVKSNGVISQLAALNVAGPSSFDSGAHDIRLFNQSNTLVGPVTLTNSGSSDVQIDSAAGLVFGASTLGSGLFTAESVGNTGISQVGAITKSGGTAVFRNVLGTNQDILIHTQANNFGGASLAVSSTTGPLRDYGLRDDYTAVSLSSLPAIARNADLIFQNSAVALPSLDNTGYLNVTVGGAITETGSLTVGGTSNFTTGAASIALPAPSNAFAGAVSLNNNGANPVSLYNVGNLVLGTSTMGSGTLNVTTASGSISQVAPITKTGGTSTFTLSGASGQDVLLHTQANNFGGGSVIFNASNAGTIRDIGLRDENGAASLAGLPTTARNIDVFFGNAAIALPALSATGHLNVTAGGAISQTGVSIVTGDSSFAAGANPITLSQANRFAGAVSLANSGASDVALTNANALTLGTVNVGSGTLVVGAVGIKQANLISQSAGGGAATFNAGTGAITLTQANGLTGAVSLNNSGTNAVELNNAGRVVLGTSSVGSGILAVTAAGGGISQTGVITKVGGASIFTASSGANQDILLHTQANDLGTGGVTFTALNGGTIRDIGLRNDNAAAALGGLPTSARNIDLYFGNAAIALPSLSATGALNVTAGGTISQTGASTVTGASTFTAGANSIALTQANHFAGDVSLTNTGANNVALTNADALTLGPVNVGSGTLTVTAVGIRQNYPISQSAAGGVALFNAGTGAITLTQANSLTGTVRLNNSGPNAVELNNSGRVVLGTSTVGSGALAVTVAGGGISQTGVITKSGGASTLTVSRGLDQDILLHTQANDLGSGAVTFAAIDGGTIRDIGLRNDNAAAALGGLPTSARNIDLYFGNAAIALPSLSATGALNVTAGGTISQTGASTVTGASTFTAGANPITLTEANHFAGDVSLTNSGANNVAVTNADALTLGTVNTGNGTLTVEAVGINQSNRISQGAGGGAATFNAGAGSIALTQANNLTGAVSLNNSGANAVVLNNTGRVVLGTSSVGTGTLAVTATGGGISQTGAITKSGGASTFTVSSGSNQDILLHTQANDLGAGAVAFTATNGGSLRDIGLRNDNAGAALGGLPMSARDIDLHFGNAAITLPVLAATGHLNVTAGGTISQVGVSTVGGASTFSAGTNAITLTQANRFAGEVSLTNSGANSVALTNADALTLGAVNVGTGTLMVTAVGINQSRTLTQAAGAGAVTFNGGSGGIALTQSNHLTGAVSLNNSGADAVAFSNAGRVVLGASSVGGGTLAVTAGEGISQTGVITKSGGSSSFTVSSGANQDIVLQTQANDLGAGVVTFAASNGGSLRDIGLRNDNAAASLGGLPTSARNIDLYFGNAPISLPSLTASGNLNVFARGAITQTGASAVTGASSFNAGANAITLTQANRFARDVSLTNTGANPVALTNANALTLGTVNVGSGALTVNAVGINQTGTIQQSAGGGVVTFNGGTGTIALTQANNLTGAVSLTNSGTNDVALTDADTLNLTGSSVGRNLTINAGGRVTMGGTFTSGGAQTYNAAIALGGNTTLAGTTLTLANPLAGQGNDLSLTFTGGNPVNGAAITGLRDLTANGGPTTLTGTVATARHQTYNTSAILGSDVTLSSASGNISLLQTVSGQGRSLSITGTQGTVTLAGDVGTSNARLSSISATGRDVVVGGDIWTLGNIALAIGTSNDSEGNDYLRFNLDSASPRNTRIDSATGEIVLGSGATGTGAKTSAPLRSSIFKSNDGDLNLFARKITVQPFERATVRNGSLVAVADGTGPGDGITLSSTAVSRFLVLSTSNTAGPSITLRSRGPADIIQAEGTAIVRDQGTDLLAGEVAFFNAAYSTIIPNRTNFAPLTPGATDPTAIDYLANTGNITANGGTSRVAILPDAANVTHPVYVADLLTYNAYRPLRGDLLYLDLGAAPGFTAFRNSFIAPPSFGPVAEVPLRTLNSSGAALNSTLFTPIVPHFGGDLDLLEKQRQHSLHPDEELVVLPEADLSAGLLEQLRALGIYARILSPSERVSRDQRAGIFVVIPGTPTPKLSDYELVNTRVHDKDLREVVRRAIETGLLSPAPDRLEQVSRSLAVTYEAFSASSQAGGAAEFHAWLAARHDSDATCVLDFVMSLRSTLRHIELLGLTRKELDGSMAQIYGSILKTRLGADPEFIRALVQDLPSSGPIASL